MSTLPGELGWPPGVALAWVTGEFGHLRQQLQERGSPEGMVDAALARFRAASLAHASL